MPGASPTAKALHWGLGRALLTQGQDVPTEVSRAGRQETERVLHKVSPGLPDPIHISAAMRIRLSSELHEANLFQRAMRTVDGLDRERMGHRAWYVKCLVWGIVAVVSAPLAGSLSSTGPEGSRQSTRVRLTYSDNPISLYSNSSTRRDHHSFSSLKIESQEGRTFGLRVRNYP